MAYLHGFSPIPRLVTRFLGHTSIPRLVTEPYRDDVGIWHDVDPAILEEAQTKNGDDFTGRLKMPTTMGFWHELNKYMAIRRGGQQMELTLSSLCFNNDIVIPDISQEKVINDEVVDLGDIMLQSTRHFTRMLIKVQEDAKFIEARQIIHPNGMTFKKVDNEFWLYRDGVFFTRLREPKLIGADFRPLTNVAGPCLKCTECCVDLYCEHLMSDGTCSLHDSSLMPKECREYICKKMDVPLLEHELIPMDDGLLLYIKRTTDNFKLAFNLPDLFYIDATIYYGDSSDGTIYANGTGAWAVCHALPTGTVDDTSASRVDAMSAVKAKGKYTMYRSHVFIATTGLPGAPTSGSLFLRGAGTPDSTVTLQRNTASDPLIPGDYQSYVGGILLTDTPQILSTVVDTEFILNANGLADCLEGKSKFGVRDYVSDYLNVEGEFSNGLEFTEGANDPYLELGFATPSAYGKKLIMMVG